MLVLKLFKFVFVICPQVPEFSPVAWIVSFKSAEVVLAIIFVLQYLVYYLNFCHSVKHYYAALVETSFHPGGSTGAVPVSTSFQINTFVAVPTLAVKPNPVGNTTLVVSIFATEFKAAVNGKPLTSTGVF